MTMTIYPLRNFWRTPNASASPSLSLSKQHPMSNLSGVNGVNETIMTLHPDSTKVGVNMSRATYDLVRQTILEVMQERGEVTFRELFDTVIARLSGNFEGAVGWYATTVKLDMEARGEIVRVAGDQGGPQRLKLA